MGKVVQMKKKPGKMDLEAIKKRINKTTGMNVAHDLTKDNPTEVKQWIPTGSRWLDSIICRGKMAGIPVGKITEIAGLPATGKSFMAAQVAGNAQKMDMQVVYFDSESSLDPAFLRRAGCELSTLMYVQAVSVEKVLETIEDLMSASSETQWLFIWDSIANTACETDIEGDFNPLSSMAVKARTMGKAFRKLTIPLANQQSTLILINQLKTNITRSIAEAMTTPFVAPGGKAIEYNCSLRVWLTKRKAKNAFTTDNSGFRIGSEVKVKLEKSRFGTEGRRATFQILWGSDVGIQDEESWFTALKLSGTDKLKQAGGWYTLIDKKGYEHKFQVSKWVEKLKDKNFRQLVYDLMDEVIIHRFDKTANEIDLGDEE